MKIDLQKIIWENKEGIIIGGVIGYFLSKSLFPSMVDFSVITQTQGMIDILASGSPLDIAQVKLSAVSSVLGSLIGGYVDSLIPEGRFFR